MDQSLWLDNITRDLLTSSLLECYIDELAAMSESATGARALSRCDDFERPGAAARAE
jgi:hypothetical protein